MRDEDPIRRLASLDLPQPSTEESVADDFERWLDATLRDDDERNLILNPFARPPSAGSGSFSPREEALTDLLRLLQPGTLLWPAGQGCRHLVDLLDRIQRVLSLSEAVMGHLRKRAAALVSDECDRLREAPVRLHAFLRGTTIGLDDRQTVLLPFGAEYPLDALIGGVGMDGLGLWLLRTLVPRHHAAFDAAVSSQRDTFGPAVESGLTGLFDEADWDAPSPAAYLAAFGSLIPDGAAIRIVLAELRCRTGCGDGFKNGPDASTWFDVLAGLRGWRPGYVRDLIHIGRPWKAFGDAALRAARGAMEDVAVSDPPGAVLCALHLMHVARWMLEDRRELADVERQRSVAEWIRGLPRGETVCELGRHLHALPLPIRSRDCTWDYLGNGTKGQWRFEVSSVVADDHGLAHGLAEFLFAFATKEAYEDVEPILFKVLRDDAGLRFLNELSKSDDRLTSLRSGSLKRAMLTRPPER